jgi:hypothetical protein
MVLLLLLLCWWFKILPYAFENCCFTNIILYYIMCQIEMLETLVSLMLTVNVKTALLFDAFRRQMPLIVILIYKMDVRSRYNDWLRPEIYYIIPKSSADLTWKSHVSYGLKEVRQFTIDLCFVIYDTAAVIDLRYTHLIL